MKPYREYADASISMHDSPRIRALLGDVLARERITHVIETGTHEGRGSTTFIAESFPAATPPRSFVTIEASWRSWRRARRNLRRFPFVEPLWGQTLELGRAIAFVESDEFIRCHDRHPDIFIDDVDDPVGFYSRELRGELSGSAPRELQRFVYLIDRALRYSGENLLGKSLERVRNANPLVILDSSGGVGWLEFTLLRETMEGRPFVLLLDDIHHVKHFRSFQHVRADPAFEILGFDERHGWMLAKHRERA